MQFCLDDIQGLIISGSDNKLHGYRIDFEAETLEDLHELNNSVHKKSKRFADADTEYQEHEGKLLAMSYLVRKQTLATAAESGRVRLY